MTQPTRTIEEAAVGAAIYDLGSMLPAEKAASGVENNSYAVITSEHRLNGARSKDRVRCTVLDMVDPELELFTHHYPGCAWAAALLAHNVFGPKPGRRFSVVVTMRGESRDDVDTLIESTTREAGGRRPDLVLFEWERIPADFTGKPEEYGQLIHTVETVNGEEWHAFKVPGTDYSVEGTLDMLSGSAPTQVSGGNL